MEVASLELLPRRGETSPLSGPVVTNASAEAAPANPHIRLVVARSAE
jgi:hypothetical protein